MLEITFQILIQCLNESSRIPRYNRPLRYGLGHNTSGANGSVRTDLYTRQKDGIKAYETVISDHDSTKAITKGTRPRQMISKEATCTIVRNEKHSLAYRDVIAYLDQPWFTAKVVRGCIDVAPVPNLYSQESEVFYRVCSAVDKVGNEEFDPSLYPTKYGNEKVDKIVGHIST